MVDYFDKLVQNWKYFRKSFKRIWIYLLVSGVLGYGIGYLVFRNKATDVELSNSELIKIKYFDSQFQIQDSIYTLTYSRTNSLYQKHLENPNNDSLKNDVEHYLKNVAVKRLRNTLIKMSDLKGIELDNNLKKRINRSKSINKVDSMLYYVDQFYEFKILQDGSHK